MKIKELLSDESKWCQGNMAKKRVDVPGVGKGLIDVCSPHDPKAECWCLMGAVFKCYMTKQQYEGLVAPTLVDGVNSVLDKLQREIRRPSIPLFNDRATFSEVKALVEKLDI